jgi:hypothetical protein
METGLFEIQADYLRELKVAHRGKPLYEPGKRMKLTINSNA